MKKVHKLEVEAFSRLGTSQRYNYFLAKLSEWQEVWGLSDDDGWVVTEQADQIVFPLWPAEAFAKLCAINDWALAEPKVVTLDVLIDEVLPHLVEDNLSVAVFMVPNREHCGVLPASELLKDCQQIKDRLQDKH